MYSIGQLAKLSKTTVRTLRYYDELGLLKASKISEGGHRYYDENDVEVLHNIITLKELGFELETIKSILLNQSMSSRELLEMRLEMIQQEQEQLKRKAQKIKLIMQVFDLEGRYDWDIIFQTFSKYKSTYKEIDTLQREYFTEEELKIIRQLPKIGDENEFNKEFIGLIKEARSLLDYSPDSEEAQSLAERLVHWGEKMYQGNWQLYNKLVSISNEKREKSGFYQFDPTLLKFIDKIIQIYIKRNMVEIRHEENNSI